MLKKLMLACMCCVSFVVADDLTSVEQKKIKHENSTSVGSKSYNNNNYKPLKLYGNESRKYYTELNFKNRQNSPTRTGTSAYSNKTFPTPPIKGEAGKEYYTKNDIKNGRNQPDQGSKSFSNRTFPISGTDDHSSTIGSK
jgi:hypothetical protein